MSPLPAGAIRGHAARTRAGASRFASVLEELAAGGLRPGSTRGSAPAGTPVLDAPARLPGPGPRRVRRRSAHVGLRRVLAAQPHLTPGVVALLAADEDEWVRRTLAESCEDAPHELLVQLYATVQDRYWSGYRNHRNFARPGLARFADDPNPRLRHAALDDPEAGPELVLRLADDPEVGGWAVRDPRLPADELLRRLTLPAHAAAAAGNPALPVAVMHHLLDLARAR